MQRNRSIAGLVVGSTLAGLALAGLTLGVPAFADDAVSTFKDASITGAHELFPSAANPSPYFVYSAEIVGSRIFMGGWLTQAEIGPDKLYSSEFVPGQDWGALTAIHWTNSGYTDGSIPNYHANDPTIVHIAPENWEFMYFTAFRNDYVSDMDMATRNWVGFASSSDGGATWTDHGVVIGQDNGLDHTGAWSPSAITADSGGDIQLYYHTNAYDADPEPSSSTQKPQRVLRTTLDHNGWQRKGTVEVTDQTGGHIALANVDVKQAFGRYWLAGNSLDQHRIQLMVSDDGVKFAPFNGSDGILVNAGTTPKLLTPTLTILSANNLNLTFSYQADAESPSTHVWNVQLNSAQ